jgi:hypothetical protein
MLTRDIPNARTQLDSVHWLRQYVGNACGAGKLAHVRVTETRDHH